MVYWSRKINWLFSEFSNSKRDEIKGVSTVTIDFGHWPMVGWGDRGSGTVTSGHTLRFIRTGQLHRRYCVLGKSFKAPLLSVLLTDSKFNLRLLCLGFLSLLRWVSKAKDEIKTIKVNNDDHLKNEYLNIVGRIEFTWNQWSETFQNYN